MKMPKFLYKDGFLEQLPWDAWKSSFERGTSSFGTRKERASGQPFTSVGASVNLVAPWKPSTQLCRICRWHIYSIGVIVGVLKRGISRCLIVMVSLGWGVIKDDLGHVMTKINFLGGIYIAVSLVRDIMTVVAYTEVQKISQEGEDELFDIVSILTLVIALIDVLFYLWIIDSLNATMEYLEGLNQTSKLRRYLRLRSILLFSILFAVIGSVFGIVDSYNEGIVEEDQEW